MDRAWEYSELTFRTLDTPEFTLRFTHSDSALPRTDTARLAIAALGDERWELVAPVAVEGGLTTVWFKRARGG
jgi:hypothetical protein